MTLPYAHLARFQMPPVNPVKYAELPAHKWLEELRLDRAWQQAKVERLTEDLGKSRKITQSYLSKIEKGTQEIAGVDPYKLEALRFVYDVSYEVWESKTGVRIPTAARFSVGLNSHPPPLLLEPNVRHTPDVIVLKVRALADAGAPHPNTQADLGDYIMPRAKYRNGLEIFVADGQSMRQTDITGIQDQDTLIIDTQDTYLRDGKVYVICDDAGGFTVKRARNWNGEWWLTSDNSKFPPFKMSDAQIIGRVTKVESERDF
jgi:transcriptional regulator with XRE-family HTH domain